MQGVTDSTGNLTFSRLDYGEYEIIQRTTSDNYKLPNTNTVVQLKVGKNNVSATISNVRKNDSNPIFITGRTSTTLRLNVKSIVDEVTPIANASFLVVGKNGVRKTITTNTEGLAILEGLTYGEYNITQISSPEGYMASPKDSNFEIPRPMYEYAEFVDVDFFNMPYDVSTYGTLTVQVFDEVERTKIIPNVKIKILDDLGNIYVGVTDSNGVITFKNFSKDRTYQAQVIESPYDYEYSVTTLQGNIKLDNLLNTQTVNMYLPKKQVNKVTIVNHETGDLSVRIKNSKFKLIHPDGSFREFEITDEKGIIEFDLPLSTSAPYILQQLTSDDKHLVSKDNITFSVGRPATVYVNNDLKNPREEKVNFKFTKEWVDKPKSNQNVIVRLMQNGNVYGNGQHFTISSDNGTQTKEFVNLPKYDENHIAYNYSVKEDSVTD